MVLERKPKRPVICLNIFETSSFQSFRCFCISANWLRIVRQELHFFACSPNWLKILFRLRKNNFFFRTKCFALIFYVCSWINFPTKIKCRTNSCIVESAFLSALQKNISFVFGILGKYYILGMELSPNGCFCTFGIITSNSLMAWFAFTFESMCQKQSMAKRKAWGSKL